MAESPDGLRPRERLRYSRQLLVPEIGVAGQAKLLAGELSLPAHHVAWAGPYLSRAGVRWQPSGEASTEASQDPARRAVDATHFAVEAMKSRLDLPAGDADAFAAELRALTLTLESEE